MTAPHDSPWAQRWLNRKHSWRSVAEGGFARDEYGVALLPEPQARAFIGQHHYSGTMGPRIQCYGLWRGVMLVGALVLGNPPRESVLRTPFPDLEPYSESAELTRLVLLQDVPANAESFFTMEALRIAERRGMRGIISHADPVERMTASGVMVKPGHYGTIYQACNATFAGHTRPRVLNVLPDGTVLSDRTLQKIVAQERNADIGERLLVRHGARARLAKEDPRAWLAEILPGLTYPLRHRGNYRYLFFLGNRRERRALQAAVPMAQLLGVFPDSRPAHGWYPKAEDDRRTAA